MTDPQTVLSVQDLSVSFDTPQGLVNVLERVNLEIREGEVLGLLGESGAGKSVLADAIMGLIPEPPGKVTGRVLYSGTDLRSLPESELAKIRGKEIAMIFQDPTSALNPVFRVGHQVAEPLEIHAGLKRRPAMLRVIDFFRRVGIPSPETRVANYPHQFSGGMRQRVVISMGITCHPKLLIADEPTCSLDVTIQAQILELIRNLVDELRSAVLFIFNDLAVISHMCQRVLIMYAGQIVEEGPVDDVFEHPRHPYTQGLIRSVPRLGARRLEPIPGHLPSVHEYLQGCRFHPRCPLPDKDAHCAQVSPALEPVRAGQRVACWKMGPDDVDAQR
ncbi:MAG: ABC transporter ATP-binding protein [candidate division NC10 bacterium]|nr:ABC transporter ATP-binding protein [candidate division NC10 bacterium]